MQENQREEMVGRREKMKLKVNKRGSDKKGTRKRKTIKNKLK